MKGNLKTMRIISLSSIILIAMFLTACGGGGDDGPTPTPTTHSISGQVRSNGTGLSGVTITLSGAGSGTKTTDSNGDYSFSGLSNGSYTVTPSLTGYTFDPTSRNVTISGQNKTGVNFSASAATYSISGQITTNGTGLSGVTITLSGTGSGTTTTDSNGDYSFSGLSNGSYTVTPSLTGYTFDPTSSNVTINGADVSGVDFSARRELDTSFLELQEPGYFDSNADITSKEEVYEVSEDEGISENEAENTITLTDPSRTYSVGDVIIGDENRRFAKKVTSVSEVNANTVLVVEDASLEDIIQQGSFSFTVTPDWSIGQVRNPAALQKPFDEYFTPSKALGARSIGSDGSINLDGTSIFVLNIDRNGNIDWTTSTIMGQSFDESDENNISQTDIGDCAGGQIKATITEGLIRLVPTTSVDYDIEVLPPGLKYAHGQMDMHVIYNIKVEMEASGAYDFETKKDLLPAITVPVTIPTTPPIYLDIELSIPAGFTSYGSRSGKATMTYKSQYSIKITMDYTRESGFSYTHQKKNISEERGLDLDFEGNISARLYLEPTVKVKLYKLVGPYVYLQPYIKAEVVYPLEADRDELFLGIGGGAGLDLIFWDLNTGNLFNIYKSWDVLTPEEGPQYSNQAPIAYDQDVTVSTAWHEITLSALDPDGDQLSYYLTDPAHGSILPPAEDLPFNKVKYKPQPGYTGSDSFTFTVHDGVEGSTTATVNITVVDNEHPVASFTYSTDGLTVYVNATGCTDEENDPNDLQVRWDWTNDGEWDTDWSYTKTGSHIYSEAGTYVIGMDVKDTAGIISSTTKIVSVNISEGGTPYPDTVIDTIYVGGHAALDLAVTPDGKYVYVTAWLIGNDKVSVIQTSDNTVIDTISVGNEARTLVITPNGDYVYVRNYGTVSVIQTSDNTVIDTISVDGSCDGLAVTPDGNYVYVTTQTYNDDTVSIIRTSDNIVIKTISLALGSRPGDIAVTPNGDYVYVAHGCTVSVIQTSDNTVIDTISSCSFFYLAVTPDGKYVYGVGHDTVSVIQTSDNTVIDTISVDGSHFRLAVTPDGNYVYVTTYYSSSPSNDDTVSIIRTSDNIVIKTISIGQSPQSVAVTPNGDYVYVASDGGTVSVIGFSE